MGYWSAQAELSNRLFPFRGGDDTFPCSEKGFPDFIGKRRVTKSPIGISFFLKNNMAAKVVVKALN